MLRLLISMCLLIGCPFAFADFFSPPLLDTKWESMNLKGVCFLSQDIPNYGKAVFWQKPASELGFSVQERRAKAYIIKASLTAKPAPWQHSSLPEQIYPVFLETPDRRGDFNRLVVHGNAAEAMIDALLQGNSPTFTYVRALSDIEMVESEVAISPVHFMDAYEKFSSCRNKLPPPPSKG